MASSTGVASNAQPPALGISTNAHHGSSKATPKTPASIKSPDGIRKQTTSPSDSSQKRLQSQKAAAVYNPITQKGIPQPQANGDISQQKPVASSKPGVIKDAVNVDKQAHDRLAFILAACTGLLVTILTSSGDLYRGVLCGCTLESAGTSSITTKMTRRASSPNGSKTDVSSDQSCAFAGSGPDFAMTFDRNDIAELSLPSYDVPEASKPANTNSTGFRTDAEITRASDRMEKPLQPWVPDSAQGTEMSLESGNSTGWDQFEANKRLFGATSTFDEHLYTTRIDRSAPSYREREKQAARLAREIEGTSTSNPHLREERGQALENDEADEEDRYSGVKQDDRNFPPLQSGQANKYTPPARRPPTAQATVAGAPFDPAIISAQVSRPHSLRSTQPRPLDRKDAAKGRTDNVSNGHKQKISPSLLNPEPINRSAKKLAAQVESSGHPEPSPRKGPENATEGVESKVLHDFRAFAAAERMKVQQTQKTRATHDRQAKLKELQTFSRSFKLRTPVPNDLVGILAKDPSKQEQIVEKARKEHHDQPAGLKNAVDSSGPTVSGKDSRIYTNISAVPKFDPSMVPGPIPDRQTLLKARNGKHGGSAPSATHTGKAVAPTFTAVPSSGPSQERKGEPSHGLPSVVPVPEGRVPPLGPSAEQSSLSSPQRSSAQTPSSAVSTKFNAKALEFKPSAAAPAFTPAAPSSIAPAISPQPIEHARSNSEANPSSPSSFFGSRVLKPPSERPALIDFFNPFPRMRAEANEQKELTKKDHSRNGGISPAYNIPPRWDVAEEYQDRTYKDVFDKLMASSVSPIPSARAMPGLPLPYQPQVPYQLQNGIQVVPAANSPHHMMQHPHPHQSHYNPYEDPHHRISMNSSPQFYPSPRLGPGQVTYSSTVSQPPPPPPPPASYGPSPGPHVSATGGPSPMQSRQYPGTPHLLHGQPAQMGAPMMAQQPSNGPYVGAPPYQLYQQHQQHQPQMPVYAASPAPSYSQLAVGQPSASYHSPGRGVPAMLPQGSQQGHHNGQQHGHRMTTYPPHQVGYGQSGPPNMRGGNHPHHNAGYGTSPGPAYPVPVHSQRAMNGQYGGVYQGKGPMPPMGPGPGPGLPPATYSGQVRALRDRGFKQSR